MVRIVVSLPRLNLYGPTTFLIDTGADFSTIHPAGGLRLGGDYARAFAGFTPSAIGGVGGQAAEFKEPCTLLLEASSGQWDQIPTTVGVAVPTTANLLLPNLVGRDVLRHYRFVFQETAEIAILQAPGERWPPSLQ